jgi:hypothetical protein
VLGRQGRSGRGPPTVHDEGSLASGREAMDAPALVEEHSSRGAWVQGLRSSTRAAICLTRGVYPAIVSSAHLHLPTSDACPRLL